ncbi:MAG TPA: DinB family protein [Gemmatimonadaceae bacterium]|nr:DinB family protein [Gemmatimonadaceae bacterium]
MKIVYASLVALALPVSLLAQQPQPPAGLVSSPIATVLWTRTIGYQRQLAQAFDSIPESLYKYKPTPVQQSIGYVAQHLATDNYLFCGNFGDMKPTRTAEDTTTADTVKATWPKAKLVAKLKESFTFCENAIGQIDDAKLAGMFSFSFRGAPPRQLPRASMVIGHITDMAEHYSQIASYMRLNNMLPPTALPRPPRPSGGQ